MVLIRKDINDIGSTSFAEPSNDHLRRVGIIRLKSAPVALISVYMRPEDHKTNFESQYAAAEFTNQFKVPYLVAEDFNEMPPEMIDTGWSVATKGVILTPTFTTITCYAGVRGSLVRYGLASKDLGHILQELGPVDQVPVKTHIGITYLLYQKQYYLTGASA